MDFADHLARRGAECSSRRIDVVRDTRKAGVNRLVRDRQESTDIGIQQQEQLPESSGVDRLDHVSINQASKPPTGLSNATANRIPGRA